MSNKKMLIALALMMSLNLSGAPVTLGADFNDVTPNHWAYQAIQDLSRMNIIAGYTDNTFRPAAPITRAEFSAMMVKALNRQDTPISARFNFRDVHPGYWGDESIQRAYNLGLIKGYPDGSFRPNDYVTKTQVLAILANAVGAGYMSAAEARQMVNRFSDAQRIPSWALVPVAKTVAANVVVNYPNPNMLMPNKDATRAEVAAMLEKMRDQLSLADTGSQQPQQIVPIEQVITATSNGAAARVILRGNIATIETNSVFPTILETPINTDTANVGDLVVLNVAQNITTNEGRVLIPAGSQISGRIQAVIPARRANRDASLAINFDTLVLPNGQRVPMQASIATETGTIEAGSLRGKLGGGLGRTAGGAAAGAALGTALGAITGRTGRGAIYGTAIGGGLGLVSAILAQGGEITIPRGEPLFIKLDSPIQVDMATGSYSP